MTREQAIDAENQLKEQMFNLQQKLNSVRKFYMVCKICGWAEDSL